MTHTIKIYYKAIFCLFCLLWATVGFANPQNGNVVSGQATITNPNDSTTHINQSSDKTIIEWDSFNIDQNELTQFFQPSSSSIALNRINGGDASKIFGALKANGQIYLINRSGIYFGPTAKVDVGGLIATTADIANSDFNSGNYRFTKNPSYNGSVINRGTINAKDQGLVVLVAPGVENSGIIQANKGKVVLGSTKAFTLDLYGDNLIHFVVDSKVTEQPIDENGNRMPVTVSNSGTISANGGKVLLTANAAKNVVDNVINMDGLIEANSIATQNGEIIIFGGDSGKINVNGQIYARGNNPGEKGGKITITGQQIVVAKNKQAIIDVSGWDGGGEVLIGGDYQGQGDTPTSESTYIGPDGEIKANAINEGNGGKVIVWADETTEVHGKIEAKGGELWGDGGFIETSGKSLDISGVEVSASAANGAAGTWLLDPNTVDIDGTYAGTIVNSLTGGTNVNVSASNAINVNAEINTGSSQDPLGTTLMLVSGNEININDAIIGGFELILDAGGIITPSSKIDVYKFILQNGSWNQIGSLPTFNVTNDFQIGPGAVFSRFVGGDGTSADPLQVADVYGLQGINSSPTLLGEHYVVINDIGAGVTQNWNTDPITSIAAGFVPIGNDSTPFTGNFDGGSYTISDLYINRPTTDYVGLFGNINISGNTIQDLNLKNVNITGQNHVGGLVGYINNGILRNVSVSGAVNGDSNIGGLIGSTFSVNNIENAYANAAVSGVDYVGGLIGNNVSSAISESYSDGSVSGDSYLGGLIGISEGANINNVYSTSFVNGTGDYIGGLIGESDNNISYAYSAGMVIDGTVSSNVGSFIGSNSGSITSSYWNTDTSGANPGIGSDTGTSDLTGLSTTQMMNPSNFTGWDFGSTWDIIENSSYPYLQWRFTDPKVIAGTVYSDAGTTAISGGVQVNLAVNGDNISTAYTGADGSQYHIVENGLIGDSDPILNYIVNNTTKGNTVFLWPTGGIPATNTLDIWGGYVIAKASPAAIRTTNLITALGSLSGSDILYNAFSGSDIILTQDINFYTDSNTNYRINGDITTLGLGKIIFNGPVHAAGGSLNTASGDISFYNILDGSDSLEIATDSGSVIFYDDVGGNSALSELTIDGNLQIGENITITTTGDQNYNEIDTDSTGPYSLILDPGAGNVIFNSDIGSTVASRLSSLTIEGNLQLPDHRSITTTGDQTYNGIDTNGTAYSLTLDPGTGNVIFNSDIGSTAASRLSSLTIEGNLQLPDDRSITTTGDQTYNGIDTDGTGDYSLTLNSDSGVITFRTDIGNVDTNRLLELTINGNMQLINDRVITTIGNQTYNGTINSDGVDINSLTLTSDSGSIIFNDNVGSSHELLDLTVNGALQTNNDIEIRTKGNQTYNNLVTMNGDLFLSGTGSTAELILSPDGIDASGNDLSLDFGYLVLDGGLLKNIHDLTVFSPVTLYSPVTIENTITTSGDQFYNMAVTLLDNTILDLTGENGTANFGLNVSGGHDLTINGNAIFSGEVGWLIPLQNLEVTGETIFRNNVTTNDSQHYHGGVEIDGVINPITFSAGGDIIFDGLFYDSVSGVHDLMLESTNDGSVYFNADVGSNGQEFNSLVVDAPVVIGAPVSITTMNKQTYNGTIDADGTGDYSLTLDSGMGDILFNADVGSNGPLSTLTLYTDLQIGNDITITTTGDQTYRGAIDTDGTDNYSLILDSGTGNVIFSTYVGDNNILSALTINGDLTLDDDVSVITEGEQNYYGTINSGATGEYDLELVGSKIVFHDDVGDSNPIGNLIVHNPIDLYGDVTTKYDQAYYDAIVLYGDTILTGRSLTLAEPTITGHNHDLSLIFSDDTLINGVDLVGIKNLTVGGGGSTRIAGNVVTNGRQTYNDLIQLIDDVVLSGTDILFNQTVDAATTDYGLKIKSDSTTFNRAVGSNTKLADLTVRGTAHIGGDINTTGDQTYYNTVHMFNGDRVLTGNTISLYDDVYSSDSQTYNGLVNLLNDINMKAGDDILFNNSLSGIDKTLMLFADDVTGDLAVNQLFLETNAAGLTGAIGGSSGQSGADKILLLNLIGSGTHFFDGIDLYNTARSIYGYYNFLPYIPETYRKHFCSGLLMLTPECMNMGVSTVSTITLKPDTPVTLVPRSVATQQEQQPKATAAVKQHPYWQPSQSTQQPMVLQPD